MLSRIAMINMLKSLMGKLDGIQKQIIDHVKVDEEALGMNKNKSTLKCFEGVVISEL